MLKAIAKLDTDHVGNTFAVMANRQHAGKVIMHRTGKNRTDDNPHQGRRAVQGTEDRTEDGTDPGDIEQVDEEGLLWRDFHIIDAISQSPSRCRPMGVGVENSIDKTSVNGVTKKQGKNTTKKIQHGKLPRPHKLTIHGGAVGLTTISSYQC